MEEFGQKYNVLASEISKFKPLTMKYTTNTYFPISIATLVVSLLLFLFIYKKC